jgi:hypothetical protein
MLTDIFAEIERYDMSLYVHRYSKKEMFFKPAYNITMKYINSNGDTVEVKRVNADFEAALIAAYEAIRVGMNEGLALALAPPEPPVAVPPSDELPF